MKKRIVGLLCALSILLGAVVAPATAADAGSDGKYDVGYAIKDINPWADPENPDVNSMVNIKLTGNGNDDNRVCTGLMDDNGDGKTDTSDGLFATCVSVTDDWGKTVMYISMDLLQGYPAAVSNVRAAVVEALGSDVIAEDQIMISGSHTHSGPNLYNISADSASAEWKTYYNYIISQITAAAVEAYNDRAPAVMKRGSIDATASTAKRYNSGKGYKMNFIRHYDVTSAATFLGSTLSTKYHVAGSNFGGSVTAGSSSAFGSYNYLSSYKVKTTSHVAEADNDMHLLTFAFEEKAPIVMVNWRAHPTTNSSTGGTYMTSASSDYVNALRYNLQLEGYRAAFIQGAGGNTVISSSIETDWKAEHTDTATSTTNTYGRLLAEIALDCIENNMTGVLAAGEIKNVQYSFRGDIQHDDEALVTAAKAVQDYYTANNAYPSFPYQHSNGSIINSQFHASNIITRSTASSSTYNNEEINVIALGDSALFVTAPNELSDRYDINGSTADADNDWLKLVNEATYGTPFVISHANGSFGYMPNYLNYVYNTDEYTTLTGRSSNGDEILGAGSYEANISRFAPGTGEKLIDTYLTMIDILEGAYERIALCPACGEEVQWKPLFNVNAGGSYMASGHYYLVEDITEVPQKVMEANDRVCLDLNGHAMVSTGRAFVTKAANTATNTPAATNAVLSIMDSAGGGSITGTAADNNPGGGTFSLGANNTMNLYGGALMFNNSTDTNYGGTGVGGVISLSGTLNVYGGTIVGSELFESTYSFTSNGCGGAIYVYSTGKINMYGGSITSGSVPAGIENGGMGPCVYLSSTTSKISLAGNASVEDIYYRFNGGSNVTISGTYTGTAGMSFHSGIALSENLDVGNVTTGADISGATLTCTDTTRPWKFKISGTNLLLSGYVDDIVAAVGSEEYTSLQEAVDNCNGTMILMIRDESKEVVVDEGADVYLDLNGCDVTGAVTVNSGYTLYCKDSKTDDYTVSDNDYGRMTNISGNVKGIPEESAMADDGYMMVTEAGETSFHRVNLDLTAMSLRTMVEGVCMPSVYYKCNFKGDEKVSGKVTQYGVALSVYAMPNANNLGNRCEYSRFTGFKSGSVGNAGNGTLLKGIMKPTNTESDNIRNADTAVFGRAYVLTEDGYMFGGGYERSLRQQVEAVDGVYRSLTYAQRETVVEMYNAYTDIVTSWTMPNLIASMAPSQDGALKVLVIGNSHGLDATNLLYEVFEDQGYDEQTLVLGALYYSGCNMTQHASFMTGSQAVYDYYENDGSNADGSWNITYDTVADTALNAHEWDIIILQQMNHRAARDDTAAYCYNAADFNTVINYVKEHQIGMPKFGWHMVWTNPDGEEYTDPDSELSHPDKTSTAWIDNHNAWFPGTDGKFDQSVMYQQTVACTQKYIEKDTSFLGTDVFDFVIPSATAVEYAQDVLGLSQAQVYRDYTHMNDYGRLITSYLWYAKLMELDQITAVGISDIPAALHHGSSEYPSDLQITEEMKADIIASVNWALANPYTLQQ